MPWAAGPSHRGDLLVLGGLFDGSLLTDDLLEALQPHVLRGLVPHARLAAVQQVQGVDVLQLRVLHALVHHQVEQLIRCVVEHLVVLPGKGGTPWFVGEDESAKPYKYECLAEDFENMETMGEIEMKAIFGIPKP